MEVHFSFLCQKGEGTLGSSSLPELLGLLHTLYVLIFDKQCRDGPSEFNSFNT